MAYACEMVDGLLGGSRSSLQYADGPISACTAILLTMAASPYRWISFVLALSLAWSFATVCGVAKEREISNSGATNGSRYLALIRQRSLKAYFPLQGFDVGKSSVRFRVDCSGAVSGIKVDEHPFHWKTHATAPLADSALIYAVNNLRLPAPPSDLGCPVAIRVIFDGRGDGPTKILPRVIETDASSEKSPKAGQKWQRPTLPSNLTQHNHEWRLSQRT
jgi:hypothetical protein